MFFVSYVISSFPTTSYTVIIKSSYAYFPIHFYYKYLSNLPTSYILIASSSH